MRYVLPSSLTWWAGLAAILIGLAGLLPPEHGQLAELAAVVASPQGTRAASPGSRVNRLNVGAPAKGASYQPPMQRIRPAPPITKPADRTPDLADRFVDIGLLADSVRLEWPTPTLTSAKQ